MSLEEKARNLEIKSSKNNYKKSIISSLILAAGFAVSGFFGYRMLNEKSIKYVPLVTIPAIASIYGAIVCRENSRKN